MRVLVLGLVVVGLSVTGVDAQSCGPTNVALGKPAVASSTYNVPTCSPALAFDGDPLTAWNSGGSGGAWIQVDLGQRQPIEQVWLDVEQSGAANMTRHVLISNNGTSFATVATSQQLTYGQQKLILPIPNATQARYVRIVTQGVPTWISYSEVGVYGANSPPLPAATLGGGSSLRDCQTPRGPLVLRMSGQPSKLWLLAVQWWNSSCSSIPVPPLQGTLQLGSSFALIASGRLDSTGQGTWSLPLAAVPKELTFRFQAAVVDPVNPLTGGFTNLHVIRY